MSINRPSQIVDFLYRSLRNLWVYRLFRYITKPQWPQQIVPLCSGRFRGGPGGPGPPLLKIPKMKKRVPPVENPKNAKGGTPFEKIINEKGPH